MDIDELVNIISKNGPAKNEDTKQKKAKKKEKKKKNEQCNSLENEKNENLENDSTRINSMEEIKDLDLNDSMREEIESFKQRIEESFKGKKDLSNLKQKPNVSSFWIKQMKTLLKEGGLFSCQGEPILSNDSTALACN